MSAHVYLLPFAAEGGKHTPPRPPGWPPSSGASRWLEWSTNYNRVTDLFPIQCFLGKIFCHSKCWDLAHLICWESKSLLQLFARAKIWKEGRVRTKSADKGLWNDCSELLRFCVVYCSPKTWSSYEIKSYGTDKNRPVRVVCGPNCRPPNSSHFRNLKRLKIDKVVSQRKRERETEGKKERKGKEVGRKATRNHSGSVS